MKVDVLKPRQLTKQRAWYYLPFGKEQFIEVHQLVEAGQARIRIPAKKLLAELLAVKEQAE